MPNVSATLATGGVTGAGARGLALISGSQAAGQQYANNYAYLRAQDVPHEQAWKQVAAPAIGSGIITAATTLLGGKSGVEAMLASGDTAVVRQALQSSWKAFFKGAAKENLEEMPTELATEILSALARDPEADVSKVIGDFIQNAPELAAAVGLLGGTGEVRGAQVHNQQVRGSQAQAAVTSPSAGPAGEANPATVRGPGPNQNSELPPLPPLTQEQVAELETKQAHYDEHEKSPEDRLQQLRAEFPDRTSPEDQALFQNLAENYDPLALAPNQPLSLMTQAKLRLGMEVPGIEGNTAHSNAFKGREEEIPKHQEAESTTLNLPEMIERLRAKGVEYPHSIDGNFRGSWKTKTTGRRARLPDGRIGAITAVAEGDTLTVELPDGTKSEAKQSEVKMELTADELAVEQPFMRGLESFHKLKPDFDQRLREVARSLPEAYVLLPNLKGAPRGIEKASIKLRAAKERGDSKDAEAVVAEQVDIIRGSIVVDSIKDIPAATEAILQAFLPNSKLEKTKKNGALIYRAPDGRKATIIDHFKRPLPGDYSDIQIIVEMRPGQLVEVQVHIPEMIVAKEGNGVKQMGLPEKYWPERLGLPNLKPDRAGHWLYEGVRSLPMQSPEGKRLLEELETLYRSARQAHFRRLDGSP